MSEGRFDNEVRQKIISKKNIISICSTIISFFLAFLIIFILAEQMIGDINTLIFGGVVNPDIYQDSSGMNPSEYLSLKESYETKRTELGLNIPFPLTFFYLLFHYLVLDFGTNWLTGNAILTEILQLLPNSLLLLATSLLVSGGILSFIFMYGYNQEKVFFYQVKENSLYTRKDLLVTQILLLVIVFIPLLTFFFIETVAIQMYDLHGGRITPGWRDDADFWGRLFLPTIAISSIGLLAGLLAYAINSSVKVTIKVNITVSILALISHETIYSWPGIGRYFYKSLVIYNFPVLMALFFLLSFTLMIVFIIIDLIPIPLDDIRNKKNDDTNIPPNTLKRTISNYMDNPLKLLNIAIGLAFISYLIIVPIIFSPYDPYMDDYGAAYQPPSNSHLFGTNWIGNDVFSRVLASLQLCGIVGLIGGLSIVSANYITANFITHKDKKGLFPLILSIPIKIMVFSSLFIFIAFIYILTDLLKIN